MSFAGASIIAQAATIDYIHEYDGTYSDSSYNITDTFYWENLQQISTTRKYTRATRNVQTTLNVAIMSFVKLDVLCRIGKTTSDYDFDRVIRSSSIDYTATASESWTIFKDTGYTAHFSKTSDPVGTNGSDYSANEWENYSATNDMGFKGKWIYD